MANPRTIASAITRLIAAGFRPPAGIDMNDQEGQTAFIAVWSDALADIEEHELNSAVRTFIKTSTEPWFPVPAKLRSLVPRVSLAIIDDSSDAFGEVLSLVGRFHHYKHPTLEDLDDNPVRARAKARAIRSVGGWDRICEHRSGDRSLGLAFKQAYKTSVALASQRALSKTGDSKMLGVG